jgi:DNA (cytosine-5)-methyltransferase 1
VKTIYAADLFCGAGGASVGLRRACEALGLRFKLLAINHWPQAIKTHMLNHPDVEHRCASVETVKPREAIPGGRLNLLLAGPSCVHHSRARGGRPVNEQERSSAWKVLDWLTELTVDNLLVENVEEFAEWGPVGVNGRPIKSKKGAAFRAWVSAIEALGYRVDWRVLNSADYGDPQTRRRLWVMAHRGRRAPTWPTPTHSPEGGRHLFGRTEKWVPARSVVDLTLPSRSIFRRRKPLAPATLRRIYEGLEKFGGVHAQPFLVVLRNHMGGRSLDEPLPTISAGGQHIALVQPFLMHVTHGRDAGRVHSLGSPLPTVTGANRGEIALCQPFVLGQQSCSAPRSVDEPLPTIATAGAISVVQPFMVPMFGERKGQTPRTHSLDAPLPTVTATKGGPALVQPFISPYNGNSTPSPLTLPLPTVTAAARLALVTPVVIDGWQLDIFLRMLRPHELSGGQGFPPDYRFTGNQGDQIKQIGNAWPCATAHALCCSVLERYAEERAPRRIEVAG